MDHQAYIHLLIEKLEKGIASTAEIEELEDWYRSFDQQELISKKIDPISFENLKNRSLQQIISRIDEIEQSPDNINKNNKPIQLWTKLLVASCFLIMLSLGAYLYLRQYDLKKQVSTAAIPDFQAASSKAILTLSDGKQVVLDQTLQEQNMTLEDANTSEVGNGDLSYAQQESIKNIRYHQLQTPRAGTYHITLADGTQAWLNAASSIQYPTAFSGNTREVKVSGEVYFEVAHNPSKPFKVITENQTIEVLGTHFNVNSYSLSSGIQTTLLEGSVAVYNAQNRELLKPGQQAIWRGNQFKVHSANLDEVMAWKEGFFDFTDANLEEMMEEFSRWYDLDIHYEGPAIKETFTGRIPRSWSFSKVMNIMKSFKSLQITAEGRRVMIRP